MVFDGFRAFSEAFKADFGAIGALAEAEMAIMTDLLRLLLRSPLEVDVIFNFNGGEVRCIPDRGHIEENCSIRNYLKFYIAIKIKLIKLFLLS